MGAVLTGLARWGQQAGQTMATMLKPSTYLRFVSLKIRLADSEADRAESQDSKIWEAIDQEFQFQSTFNWVLAISLPCQLNRETADLNYWKVLSEELETQGRGCRASCQECTPNMRGHWQVNVELLLEILSELRVVVKARCLG